MSDRDSCLYLRDMLDSITAIESFLVGVDRNLFASDRKTFSATIRELEIIGEAASRVAEEIRNRNPQIAWRMLKDFRNVLAHHYFGVNVEIVWDVVQRKLPELKVQIGEIISKPFP
jgi:uncharacterized protein with HEPN domain